MQAPPLYIGGATLLGYNQSIEYFGSDIGFKKNIAITVECVSDDITGGPSSTSVFSLVDGVKDYGELFINGQGFGPAKLTSFSAGATNMEDSITVTVSFLICEAYDDLSSLSGYYDDYKAAEMIGCMLESFSDTLNLGRGENSTSYTRDISITANDSQNLTDTAGVIANFARVILGFTTFSFPDLSGFDSELNDLTGSNIKKNITETVDAVGLNFSFKESMSAGNVKGTYSLTSTRNYTKNEQGISTVSESGTILGLTDPRFTAAEAGYATEVAGAGARLKTLFEEYNDDSDEAGCAGLNTNDDGTVLILTSGRTENTFEGTISYKVSSNNDPQYADTADEGTKWTYTTTVVVDQTATEQGTVEGKGNEIYNKDGGSGLEFYTKYQDAQTFYGGKIGDINSRVSALISSPSPNPISRSESHSPSKGTIGYTKVYSSNPKYAQNDGIVKSISHSTSTKKAAPMQNRFVCLSPENAQEIVQAVGPKSLEEVTNSIQIVGYRRNPSADPITSITEFGDIGIDELSEGATDWLSDLKYTFKAANDVAFTMSATYLGGDSCP